MRHPRAAQDERFTRKKHDSGFPHRAVEYCLAEAGVALPEVDYVVITAGSFDLLAEAVCEDDDDLLHIVSSRIRTIPGVRSTETFVYLKLRKQLYNWGTR